MSDDPTKEGRRQLRVAAKTSTSAYTDVAQEWFHAEPVLAAIEAFEITNASDRDVSLLRGFSYAVAKTIEHAGQAGQYALFCLLATRLSDRSTTINTLTAVLRLVGVCDRVPSALRARLSARLREALVESKDTAEVALQLLENLMYRNLLGDVARGAAKRLVLQAVTSSVAGAWPDPNLVGELEAAISQAGEGRSDSASFRWDVIDIELDRLSSPDVEGLRSRLKQDESTAAAEFEACFRGVSAENLRIEGRPGGEVLASTVSRLIERWAAWFEELVDSPMVSVGAATGSFVIRLISVNSDRHAQVLRRVGSFFNEPDDTRVLGILKEEEFFADYLLKLLHAQTDEASELDLTAVDPDLSLIVHVRITHKRAKRLAEIVTIFVQGKLDSASIPQADDLDRVFTLVDVTNQAFVNRAETVTPSSIGVTTPRQLSYYRHAARLLGFIDNENSLAPAGQQLVRLTGNARKAFTAVRFESTECAQSWLRWSHARSLAKIDPNSAEPFLLDVAVLSHDTSKRRAKTLSSWTRELRQFHYDAASE